ncbi:hypothetical protein MOO44_01100 (plasmid) [Nicoliella spurrieriana]|uniref:Uncharacterized protein n=1 Tax=Nicoliella spurrieriana TaxID=2925830 RepID=A0A976RQC9_9LACO|nr:hypothetical protein [Nicoliella spurrieriana]UQS85947.1 hypothetical protein MOO44_01100 [Nicoliella spurrieriana]
MKKVIIGLLTTITIALSGVAMINHSWNSVTVHADTAGLPVQSTDKAIYLGFDKHPEKLTSLKKVINQVKNAPARNEVKIRASMLIAITWFGSGITILMSPKTGSFWT